MDKVSGQFSTEVTWGVETFNATFKLRVSRFKEIIDISNPDEPFRKEIFFSGADAEEEEWSAVFKVVPAIGGESKVSVIFNRCPGPTVKILDGKAVINLSDGQSTTTDCYRGIVEAGGKGKERLPVCTIPSFDVSVGSFALAFTVKYTKSSLMKTVHNRKEN